MSTRGSIGRLNRDGTITVIYSHANNYPEANGWLLATHYTDPAKVDTLIALEAVSEIGLEIGEKHPFTFDTPRIDGGWIPWCRSYFRDRGETTARAQTITPDAWPMVVQGDIEMVFLYAVGTWLCAAVKGAGISTHFGDWYRLIPEGRDVRCERVELVIAGGVAQYRALPDTAPTMPATRTIPRISEQRTARYVAAYAW